MNTENINSTLNFRNDHLLLENKLILNKRTLNWYITLVKKEDFNSSKASHSIFTTPYLYGGNLTKIVKKHLQQMDKKYKKKNFLLLRKAFRTYCSELSIQRTTQVNKLLKNWFNEKRFPFTFLRVLADVSSKGNRNLEEKIISRFIISTDAVASFFKPHVIKLPKTFNDLNNKAVWYFIGVCVGDGSLLANDDTWRLQISDGSPHKEELDDCEEFLQKLKQLIEREFKTKLSNNCIKKQEGNWYNLHIFDKCFVRFLNFFFNLPIGDKIGKLSVPKILEHMKNKKLLERYFWRGVFDTDGMIDRKGKHIVLASSDDNLIKQCQEFLKKLGIRNSIKSKKDNDGNPYKTLEIESGYIKDFATLIGTSHPLKQRILYSHLQKPLKYYILQNLNRINITKDGKFNLKLLKNKDKRVSLPECPSTELLRIASYVSVIDSEKKRIIFRTKGVKFTDFQEILNDFEVLFGLEPKFLSTRNMWYVNSQLVNEFFRKFFIYDLPWNPLQKDEVDKLLRNWNGIYGF